MLMFLFSLASFPVIWELPGRGLRLLQVSSAWQDPKQTNQECPRHAWHHASQAYSQALAWAGPWAEALEPGPWPLGGSWALGPGLGTGRRRPGAQRAAAWAQARAQGPGPAQRPRPELESFSPRPCEGQSLGIRLTCMMPGMPRTFLIRLL